MSIKQYIKRPIKHGLRFLQEWSWIRQINRLPATKDGKRLLHIGCGEVNSPEFINLDARPLPHVHIVSKNLFKLRMIPDASLDMIYMCHVLEHVPRNNLTDTIREMARALKTNGTLRISVPDFDCIIRIYESTGKNIHSITAPLMGGQGYAFNYHYSVFNQLFLTELLSEGGFHQVAVWNPEQCANHDFEDWASKKVFFDGNLFPISLNLEGKKLP